MIENTELSAALRPTTPVTCLHPQCERDWIRTLHESPDGEIAQVADRHQDKNI